MHIYYKLAFTTIYKTRLISVKNAYIYHVVLMIVWPRNPSAQSVVVVECAHCSFTEE